MMVDNIKQFIGKDGVNIRKLRKLNKCKVFIIPILFQHHGQLPRVFFEIWTKPIEFNFA